MRSTKPASVMGADVGLNAVLGGGCSKALCAMSANYPTRLPMALNLCELLTPTITNHTYCRALSTTRREGHDVRARALTAQFRAKSPMAGYRASHGHTPRPPTHTPNRGPRKRRRRRRGRRVPLARRLQGLGRLEEVSEAKRAEELGGADLPVRVRVEAWRTTPPAVRQHHTAHTDFQGPWRSTPFPTSRRVHERWLRCPSG